MTPSVGIIMGSQSDWATMREAATLLDELGVTYEAKIVSAHRTPDRLWSYGKDAASRGLQVIIAGAGGAAHLPGMLASVTSLPVIGVPVPLRHLDGLDSLLSIVQMPAGIPVATVAVGGAHLPGMMASKTRIPVIGVPVQTKALSGVDSLYSIVQMPKGFPVATMAIGAAGAANAALMAAGILALNDAGLASRLDAWRAALSASIPDEPTDD